MNSYLSKLAIGRDNNFNLIRFFAACLVLFSHSFSLLDKTEPLFNSIGISFGTVAVDIFFITSGFLICSSFYSKKDIVLFTRARVLRIFPAIVFCTFMTVFFLGPYFTTNSLTEYFSSANTYEYLLKNSTLIFGVEYDLPGVFQQNYHKDAVNGSLWTLPHEIKMYFFLAIFSILLLFIEGRFPKFKVVLPFFLFIGLLSVIGNVLNHFYDFRSHNTLKLFSMFFIGAVFYLFRDKVLISNKTGALLLGLLAISFLDKDWFFVIYTVTLPYLVFYFAYGVKGKLLKFNNAGDYSYGIYIYAFPVQQSIVAMFPDISVVAMILLAFSISFILAFMSWNYIEKKFLRI